MITPPDSSTRTANCSATFRCLSEIAFPLQSIRNWNKYLPNSDEHVEGTYSSHTAGVREKECKPIQKNWRYLALNSRFQWSPLIFSRSYLAVSLVTISWMSSKNWQPGELQEISNIPWKIGAGLQMSASIPFWVCHLSFTLLMWVWLRQNFLVLIILFLGIPRSPRMAALQVEKELNELLILELKAGSDKNHCATFVFRIVSHQQETHVSGSLLFEKNFKVHSQCCVTGVWAGQEKLPSENNAITSNPSSLIALN